MKYLFNQKRMRSLIAGALAAMIFTVSLAGCQGNTLTDALPSQTDSSQVSLAASSSVSASKSEASSQAVSSESVKVSSAVSSDSSRSVSSAAAVKTVQKVQTTSSAAAKSKAVTPEIKKIADDKSTVSAPRLSVIQTTALATGYTHIDQRSGYNALPDLVSRNLYSLIAKSVYKVTATATSDGYYPTQRVTLSGSQLSEAQLRLALIAYLNDNPQVFWIANVYSYGYSPDNNDTYVQLYSYVSQSQCNTMIQQLNTKVSTIMKAMPSGLSEFDRELYLFNYLTQTISYDNAAAQDTSLWKSFNAYGALMNGKVVCEGYSRAMQLLSSYSNLQCALVTGQGSGVNHMWNLIQINGNWYHLDITWCDGDTPVYNYFNVTDAVITQTHTVSPIATTLSDDEIDGTNTGDATQCNLFLPACTATEENYFIVKGTRITDLSGTDDSAAIAAVSAAVKGKKQTVSFYIDQNIDFASTLSGLVQSSPYKLVSYLNSANSQAGLTSKVNISGVKYIADQANRGLTVFLSYQ
jgi:transglutaminase/protease-like cytokinesis protein 3